jgi:NADH-quinone oxidoreductase subunit B
LLPGDVYGPGWPPRRVALIEGLLLLQQVVAGEKRPLSWVAGSQEVCRPEMGSMRDMKRAARAASTILRSPDEI